MMPTTPLGKVVEVSAGQPAPKPDELSSHGHPFIRAGSLEGLVKGEKSENDCEMVDDPTARSRRLKLYPVGTVLFAKSGMSAKLGRVYRLREPSYVVSHLAALTPTGKYDPSYLTYWLRMNSPSRLIRAQDYPSIRTSEIAAMEVPDILVDEQRRIAKILDKADAIRRKREQSLVHADELVKSAFLEMFGDPLSNPKNWPVRPLKDYLLEIRYGTSIKCWDLDCEDCIPVLRIPNIVDGMVSWEKLKYARLPTKDLQRLQLMLGDILFVRTNGNPDFIGRCAVFESSEEAAFASYLIRARLRNDVNVTPLHVQTAVSMPSYRQRMIQEAKTTAGNYNINIRGLRSLPIIEPPKETQATYARLVSQTRKVIARDRRALEETKELLASLSQRAFRGKL